jgi:hypothetical protein
MKKNRICRAIFAFVLSMMLMCTTGERNNPCDSGGSNYQGAIVTTRIPTTDPDNATITEGQSISFSVAVKGNNVQYQWWKDGVEITNANSATFAISAAKTSQSGKYRCFVWNDWGADVSLERTLKVNPSITTYSLTISSPTGGSTTPTGTVTLSSGGGQLVTASPAPGYTFTNWTVVSGSASILAPSSASTSVSITSNAAIRANFTEATYTLTMSSTTGGSTTPTGTLTLSYGVSQSIAATPSTGHGFSGWSVVNGSATIANINSISTTVSITSNSTIKAIFNQTIATGNFLAWTGSDDSSHYFQLVRINKTTGTITNIGSSTTSFFTDLEYGPDGALYGIGNSLNTINPLTGVPTKIGDLYYGSAKILMCGAGFSKEGNLYAIENNRDSGRVFTVNLSNGTLTYAGKPSSNINDFAFSTDGTLYANSLYELYKINKTNMSTISDIGSFGSYKINSLAFGIEGALFGSDAYPSTNLYSITLATAVPKVLTAMHTTGVVCIIEEHTITTMAKVTAGPKEIAPKINVAELLAMELKIKEEQSRRISTQH